MSIFEENGAFKLPEGLTETIVSSRSRPFSQPKFRDNRSTSVVNALI